MVDLHFSSHYISRSIHIYRSNHSRNSLMLEADIIPWINILLFPFMPVITMFIASAIMLSGLAWNDDDGSRLISPVYNYVPQGA